MSTKYLFDPKDPSDVDDFAFDWTDSLDVGETISLFEVSATGSLTVGAVANNSGVIVARISGGDAVNKEEIVCKITTSAGRVLERTATVLVKNI